MLQATEKVKLGIPPAFKDAYVIRVLEKKFGPNSNDDPMVTITWELVGKPNIDGTIDTEVRRGDTSYKIAGLRVKPTYYTLIEKGVGFYRDLYQLATGEPFQGVDETNPDLSWLDKLSVLALLVAESQPVRKELTNEEKVLLKQAGKPLLGEPILDGDGKPITRDSVRIDFNGMLSKYTGALPPF